jgi:putative DNA primase/helicase
LSNSNSTRSHPDRWAYLLDRTQALSPQTAALELSTRHSHVTIIRDGFAFNVPYWDVRRLVTLTNNGTCRVIPAYPDWEPSDDERAEGPGPYERNERRDETPMAKLIAVLFERGYRPRRLKFIQQYGTIWRAKCPCGDGQSYTSLSFGEFGNGNVWVKSFHIGCSRASVLAHLGLKTHELYAVANGEPEWSADSTELSNARRLVKQYGEIIRYCEEWRRWLIWDGKRWKRDSIGRIEQLAKETVLSIYREAAEAQDQEKRGRLAKWAVQSEKRYTITNMVRLAQTEPGVPVEPAQLDADPWLFNVTNGTINLHTGKLLDHDPKNLITKLAPIKYDPSAACPQWAAFLGKVHRDNAEIIAFLQRVCGLSMVGEVLEHLLLVLYGTGRNGKTTFMETMLHIFGEYGMQADPKLLLVRQGEVHPSNVANLRGMRLVSCMEPEAGSRLAESQVNWLTGGDKIRARRLYQDWADAPQFEASHTAFLITNHKPIVQGTDRAIWERIKLVGFTVFIPREERDKQLKAKLRREATGILAWAVAGCLSWQRDGLREPESVTLATDTYRKSMDVIGDFLEEMFEIADPERRDLEIKSEDLYGAYTGWCEAGKLRAMTQRAFADVLHERGFENSRTASKRFWWGFRLAE